MPYCPPTSIGVLADTSLPRQEVNVFHLARVHPEGTHYICQKVPCCHNDHMQHTTHWSVIIPLSSAASAKSRLSVLGSGRTQLARAFAQDVIDAAAQVDSVGLVLLVGDGSLTLTGEYEQLDPGEVDLNSALVAAEGHARGRGYHRIAVIMADLPCITPEILHAILASARSVPRGFVRDYRGAGTTVITTTGPSLAPRFGSSSAQRHYALGALELSAPPQARLDVDEPGDIGLAMLLGLGAATAAALASLQPQP